MKTTTFLYTLQDPNTGLIRYLGKSDNPFTRFRSHLSYGKTREGSTNSWIKSLLQEGKRPLMDLLDEVPYSQWEFWEREYIRVFRAIGIPLLNIHKGGTGMSEETRKRGGRKKGAKLTELHKTRIAQAHRGKTISETERKRLLSMVVGRPASDKQKAAVSIANSHPKSEQTKNNMREGWILRRLPKFIDGGGI